MNRTHALATILVGAISIVGCASSDDVGSDSANIESGAAASTCAGYASAKAFYDKAVRGAVERLDGKTCDDGTYLLEIADNATQAVMICPELKATIKSDPGAEPIRAVLSDSLTLHALTGELLVLRNSEFQNWNGVEDLLAGKTFTTEPQGAMGWYVGFKFFADGKAAYVTTRELDGEPWVDHPESPATYEVVRTGDVRAPRKVIVTYEGQTVELDLTVTPSSGGDSGAPIFQLVPPGQDPSQLWKTYNSLVGECEA